MSFGKLDNINRFVDRIDPNCFAPTSWEYVMAMFLTRWNWKRTDVVLYTTVDEVDITLYVTFVQIMFCSILQDHCLYLFVHVRDVCKYNMDNS